jgi:hypothetical protein
MAQKVLGLPADHQFVWISEFSSTSHYHDQQDEVDGHVSEDSEADSLFDADYGGDGDPTPAMDELLELSSDDDDDNNMNIVDSHPTSHPETHRDLFICFKTGQMDAAQVSSYIEPGDIFLTGSDSDVRDQSIQKQPTSSHT